MYINIHLEILYERLFGFVEAKYTRSLRRSQQEIVVEKLLGSCVPALKSSQTEAH